MISNVGGMRVSPENAIAFSRVGRGKQLFGIRGRNGEVLPHGTRPESLLAFNAAYAGYVRNVFDTAEVNGIMNSPDPKEELLGDAVEIALGILAIANRYPSKFTS